MRRVPMLSLGAMAALLVAGGCAAVGIGGMKQVPDADLAGLTPEQMRPVHEARSELNQAKKNADDADRAVTRAENELSIAKSQLSVSKAKQKQAKTLADVARKRNEGIQRSEKFLDYAKADREASEKLVNLRGEELTLAKDRSDLAQKKMKLAQANLEYVQAQAVAKGGTSKINVAEFQAQVSDHRAHVASAEAVVQRQIADVNTADQSYKAAHSRAQAMAPEERPTG